MSAPARVAKRKGPWLEILERLITTAQRSFNNTRQKHLGFDSSSHLLLYVQYRILTPRASRAVTNCTALPRGNDVAPVAPMCATRGPAVRVKCRQPSLHLIGESFA